MKKKIWDLSNTPSTDLRGKGTYLMLYPKTGTITFSQELVEKLNLIDQPFVFVQDEERNADWYIELSTDKNAVKVRPKNKVKKYQQYIFQSALLVRTILESAKLPLVSTRINVAAEAQERNLFAILTKSAVSNKKSDAA